MPTMNLGVNYIIAIVDIIASKGERILMMGDVAIGVAPAETISLAEDLPHETRLAQREKTIESLINKISTILSDGRRLSTTGLRNALGIPGDRAADFYAALQIAKTAGMLRASKGARYMTWAKAEGPYQQETE